MTPADTVHWASSGGGSLLPHPAVAPSAARASRAAIRRGMGGMLRPPTTVTGSASFGLRPGDRQPRAARARGARGRAPVPARGHRDRRPPGHPAARGARAGRDDAVLARLALHLPHVRDDRARDTAPRRGAGPGGGRARLAGAVARAGRRGDGGGRRRGVRAPADRAARRRGGRRRDGGALPADRVARGPVRAGRARRPGLAARRRQPAHPARDRRRREPRERRARGAVRLRLRLGPRRLARGAP